MKYSCIIVDDEQRARSILKRYINDVPLLQLEGEFKNAIDTLDFLQYQSVDLMFADIEMPKLSGINLAKIVANTTKVVFTTAHREFAIDGFELNAVDYLLKPFSFDRFLKSVHRITNPPLDKSSVSTIDYTYVKANKQMVKIEFSNLLYIEGLSNYIKIHTIHKSFVVYEKLSSIAKSLPADSFMRIHKSYIVNTKKIQLYTREYVKVHEKQIPISLTYRTKFLSFLKSQ